MSEKSVLLCFGILWLLLNPVNIAAQILNYEITYLKASPNQAPRLAVKLDFFTAAQEDTVTFRLPTRINWTDHLQHCFQQISSADGELFMKDSATLAFIPKKAGKARLFYEVAQYFPEEQVTLETSCGPIIQSNYIHVPGECLFLVPGHYYTFKVSVSWNKLPTNWAIQTSFNHNRIHQSFKMSSLSWLRTMWVAGDFRIYEGQAHGKPYSLSIRGKWPFTDTALQQLIQETVESHRVTWEDQDLPYYAVSLIPFVVPKGIKMIGDGRTGACLGYGMYQSFVLFANEQVDVMNELIDVVNHEMTHDWIGGKINTGYNKGATSLRWMTEGFSDYYAMRNRWKTGRWAADDFFDQLNEEVIAPHYKDPNAELNMADLEAHYFDSLSYEMVPYRRGCILAFYLDCMIRSRTGNEKTLHHYMMDLLEYSYGRDKNLEENTDFLRETLEEYIGPIAGNVLQKYGFEGKKIPFKAFELPDFIQMKKGTLNLFQFSLRGTEAENDFLK